MMEDSACFRKDSYRLILTDSKLSGDMASFKTVSHTSHARNGRSWVVLLNGLLASKESWDAIIPTLHPHFNIAIYDGPGHGKTDFTLDSDGAIGLDQHSHYLKYFLDTIGLGLDKESSPFFLVGISNGARVGLKFAEMYEEHVHGLLALVCCSTYNNVSKPLFHKLQSWLMANEVGGNSLRFEVALPWIWGESFINSQSALIDSYRKIAKDQDKDLVKSKEYQARSHALILGAMKSSVDLRKINTPICFIVGDEDVLTPLNEHQKMHEARLCIGKKSLLKNVNGGHACLLEYPQIVTDEVIPFLNSITNGHQKKVEEFL